MKPSNALLVMWAEMRASGASSAELEVVWEAYCEALRREDV